MATEKAKITFSIYRKSSADIFFFLFFFFRNEGVPDYFGHWYNAISGRCFCVMKMKIIVFFFRGFIVSQSF